MRPASFRRENGRGFRREDIVLAGVISTGLLVRRLALLEDVRDGQEKRINLIYGAANRIPWCFAS